MATDTGDVKGVRRPVMPYVAYAVVLALLGGVGVMFWTAQRDRAPILPTRNPPPPAAAMAAPAESAPPAPAPAPPPPAAPAPVQTLKLPPRPVPAVGTPAALKPVPAPAPTPAAAAAAPAPEEKPAPAKTRCTVDGAWPAERTDQGKAIQRMLRDLGLYDGTVYGTVGPTTRAAIRRFQVAAGDPETGEPDQALFDSLKKKCGAP